VTSVRVVPCVLRKCIHFRRPVGPSDDPVFVCKAFPLGVPEEVLSGANDHTHEISGDDGFRYTSDVKKRVQSRQ
jgi:hypothetical protein